MGWASANRVFDTVALALTATDATDTTKRHVLTALLGALNAGDWDTHDESMEKFRDDPVVLGVFRAAGYTPYWEQREDEP